MTQGRLVAEVLIPIVPLTPAAAAMLNLYPYIHHFAIYQHYNPSPLPAVIATLWGYTDGMSMSLSLSWMEDTCAITVAALAQMGLGGEYQVRC